MKTKFIIFLILFLHLGFKAQEVDTLETNKRNFQSKSSVGIGFLNFGSLFSLLYLRKLRKNIYFRVNIGDNSFLNGNTNGISIAILPEYRLINVKNKVFISVNTGLLYSKSFVSEFENGRSINLYNIGNYGKGGQIPSYKNHFCLISSLNLDFIINKRISLEFTGFYYYFRQYHNINIKEYENTKSVSGFLPSLSFKYLMR